MQVKTIQTHGMSSHPIYQVWNAMKQRCKNKNWSCYHRYGGRGITYDPRWEDFQMFYDDMFDSWKFWLHLDRKDNSAWYFKWNCRWITPKQNCNNKDNNHVLIYKWESRTLSEWADRYWIIPGTLSMRINAMWWSVEMALETPIYNVGVAKKIQMLKDGLIICEFESISSVKTQGFSPTNVNHALKWRTRKAHWYEWRYKQ